MRKISFFIGAVAAAALFYTCNDVQRNASHAGVPLASMRKGKDLAIQYCQSCHLLPDPALLDAKSWEEGVLPNMGPRLGIFAYGFQLYPSAKGSRHLPPDFYPAKQQLSFVEWQHIIDYYTATAPDTLLPVTQAPLPQNLHLFDVLQPLYKTGAPMVSYTGIHEAQKQIIAYDITGRLLLTFDSSLQLKDSLPLQGAVSDIKFLKPSLAIWANMGNMNPDDAPAGSVQQLNFTGNKTDTPLLLFKNLQRPVALQSADINTDGRTDYVVGSFGFLTGHLSWYEAMQDGGFKQHIIKPVPGAAQVYVTDDNGDGRPDLWVLFAQGDESIRHFVNKGGGAFEEKGILRFPPVWGSTSFELADMNGDGSKDIVYTCGDNADYSPVLKPYHGVYVFLKEGPVFRQRYFYPLYGAFKARVLDFDGDGDQDIAAISFFADYKRRPEEGFVYLENKGGLQFHPSTIPQASAGRWITMDAGDVNGDGAPDIVLGNMAKGFSTVEATRNWSEGPLLLLLKNKAGK